MSIRVEEGYIAIDNQNTRGTKSSVARMFSDPFSDHRFYFAGQRILATKHETGSDITAWVDDWCIARIFYGEGRELLGFECYD